ncbi:hypothetical protein C8R44DRAFT_353200 [Mycena epipterygia]|nr:hypothetical protein C8R44DRAFT_353200 [Mycena epipterygia]
MADVVLWTVADAQVRAPGRQLIAALRDGGIPLASVHRYLISCRRGASDGMRLSIGIIVAMNSLTRHDIPFACCIEDWDDVIDTPQIMDSISRNIPHTKTLQLVCLHADFDDNEIVDTIRHIKEFLPRFTSLVYLAVEGYRPVEDEYENQIKVEAWGNACSTLEACSLSNLSLKSWDIRLTSSI